MSSNIKQFEDTCMRRYEIKNWFCNSLQGGFSIAKEAASEDNCKTRHLPFIVSDPKITKTASSAWREIIFSILWLL
jgi:hypothetical protein